MYVCQECKKEVGTLYLKKNARKLICYECMKKSKDIKKTVLQ